jgi:hypothetical protein
MININIISNFEKHWCTFCIKKKFGKEKEKEHYSQQLFGTCKRKFET